MADRIERERGSAAAVRVITVDVRDDMRQGRGPFSRIMKAVGGLEPDQALKLIAPFEPVPLYEALAQQGFDHAARQTKEGAWEVLFSRSERGLDSASEVTRRCVGTTQVNGAVIEVDARGLEPPEPLVRILEALVDLPPRAMLRARTDRRPMHLYAQLEQRGFWGESEAEPDGSFVTNIRVMEEGQSAKSEAVDDCP